MSLKQELSALRARLEGRPPEVVAAMHRTIHELRASDAPARVLKAGARAPDFALPDAYGQTVDSWRLLACGPLVVTFYRGRW